MLIDQQFSQLLHPASGFKIWPTVRVMSKIHRAWYTRSRTEALFQLRDGSGTLLPFAARGACPVRDEAAQMSLLHRRRASSSSSLFSPESIKNKILRSRCYLEVTTPVGKERKKDRDRQRGNCLPLVLSHVSDALTLREGSESKSQQVLDTGVLGYHFHFQQQSWFFSCLAFPLCCMCFVENSVWCLKINHQIKTQKKFKKKRSRSFIVCCYSQWVKCRALSDVFTLVVVLYRRESSS